MDASILKQVEVCMQQYTMIHRLTLINSEICLAHRKTHQTWNGFDDGLGGMELW